MGRGVYWLTQLTSPVAYGVIGFSNISINLGPVVSPVWVLGQLHPDSEWPWGSSPAKEKQTAVVKEGWMDTGQARTTDISYLIGSNSSALQCYY